MVQLSNQFILTNEKGRLTNKGSSPYVTNQTIDSAYAGADLTSSEAFKYVGSGGSNFVTPATANGDKIIGFATFNVIKNSFSADSIVELAHRNSEMIMEAGTAFEAGIDLEYNVATKKVIAKAAGTTIGISRQASAADGDLIPVAIDVR